MAARSLRIAWLGPAPGGDGGVPGVTSELLDGLSSLGHRIDCFFPSTGQPLPERLLGKDNLTFTGGTPVWHWDGCHSRSRIPPFASGMVARALASLRLRREILRRHRAEPYD